MSAPEQRHNFERNDRSRERSLPPIREVLGVELGNTRSAEQHSHGFISVGSTSARSPPGDFSSRSTPPDTAWTPSRQGDSSTSPIPVSSSPVAIRSMPSGSHSYGVLRASGTSGGLTDAIPPSAYPQGIIRQTSYSAVEEQDEVNKRYKCDYCGKRFGMPNSLTNTYG
ncbi:hypothetical protein Clacol_007326 [Clathrus columnatus]|uniref:C2H2-type domain-containing protein n=1 Tax=Clathrus columnatus TaxID=1419009 RepID=A0AAV5AJF9_9AGAM|nr:hypothetical protein Clacol_007326 [Clathrus columnatus]